MTELKEQELTKQLVMMGDGLGTQALDGKTNAAILVTRNAQGEISLQCVGFDTAGACGALRIADTMAMHMALQGFKPKP
jgi:hypothetical protein